MSVLLSFTIINWKYTAHIFSINGKMFLSVLRRFFRAFTILSATKTNKCGGNTFHNLLMPTGKPFFARIYRKICFYNVLLAVFTAMILNFRYITKRLKNSVHRDSKNLFPLR